MRGSRVCSPSPFFVAAWQAPRFASVHIPAEMYLAYRPWLFATAGVLGVSAILMYRATVQRIHLFAAAGVAALLAFQIAAGLSIAGRIAFEPRHGGCHQPRRASGCSDLCRRNVLSAFAAVLFARTITLVAFKGELEMGIDLEPDKWIATPADFYPQWQKETQAIAIFDQAGFAEFRKLNLPMKVIYEGARRIAVLKQEAKQ